jgi:hypothetical protein
MPKRPDNEGPERERAYGLAAWLLVTAKIADASPERRRAWVRRAIDGVDLLVAQSRDRVLTRTARRLLAGLLRR